MPSAAADLRAELAQALLELAMCASAPARLLLPTTRGSRPGSTPPRSVDDPTALYRERRDQAGDDVAELTRLLELARRDLAHLKARHLAPLAVETREELD